MIPIQLQGVERNVILDERRNHLNHCLLSVVSDVLRVENLFKMVNCEKRKLVEVLMELRLDALKRTDKDKSLKSIALSFSVGGSTVSDWKKKRKELESFCSKLVIKGAFESRFTLKKPKLEKLDDRLLLWFN
ncbi:hypothetical protein AVEN_275083-1 [Araneus ventricosus]|uniref:Uncharacterized protein n=1 Tax=Araneus ventricosus TaxID=182803 RepID=A0A4Y2UTP4_ARAVE|nr:hypothetical protein AVEN_275083-1 [Araneus ventricosus]